MSIAAMEVSRRSPRTGKPSAPPSALMCGVPLASESVGRLPSEASTPIAAIDVSRRKLSSEMFVSSTVGEASPSHGVGNGSSLSAS